ncbi:aspartate kinase [Paracrocinitomix mangrovi]|uniref:aspartate kinase n=1 Tax=Paracrocinitomix mangrovi TaxID=2862509 RepID=UPI001C8D1D54|nr:aspartate kinase [Paracrocinitomix mangrovi]UKN00830.1 aspartate kinase [Paracrocinitomix mangrovi]
MLRVFKFGGASVKNADAVRNVADIIKRYPEDQLIVVISAMGKTTNALEDILNAYWNGDNSCQAKIDDLNKFHREIVKDLFTSGSEYVSTELEIIFQELSKKCKTQHSENYNFEYDQIVSLGEVISTKIVHAYLNNLELDSSWLDARKVVATDNKWREARINWEQTEKQIQSVVKDEFISGQRILISQGFIGHTPEGLTTTLGREGSDFSAAIFAYVMEADNVTIWKDVPGMLNADPKWFDNTILLEKISFREAIELAYFGASVIHPRTIQPLKRKNIPLYIKSFVNPEAKGSVIQSSEENDNNIPSFIFKMDQVLVSISPKDFSFVIEENLEEIFAYLNKESIRMNIMQNSAVSFSFCCDKSRIDIDKLIEHFKDTYIVKYNEPLELVTIRHYDDATIKRVTTDKKVILQQKTRETARIVMLNI